MSLYSDSRALRRRYRSLWLLEHAVRTFARRDLGLRARRLAVHAALVEQARQAPVARQPLERVQGLSPADFQARYVRTDVPVVLAGAARDWPCTTRWTPAFFGEVCGSHSVRLLQVAPGQEPVPGQGRDASYAEIAASTEEGGALYARFSGLLHQRPELQQDLDMDWLRAMRGARRGENLGFFMGGAGTATGLHASIAPNLFVQARGRKRWTIHPAWTAPFFAPVVTCAPYFTSRVDLHDPQQTPWADRIPGWTGVLEPGDVLWVPSFAWHQVENPEATVAVGYRWMSPRMGVNASALHTLIAATSTNPAPWRAKGHKDLPELLDSIEY